MNKIIDINNQVEQVAGDIIKSNDIFHFVIEKNGVLYITDIEDAEHCIENLKYNNVGVITKTNSKSDIDIKRGLRQLIKEYNN